MKNALFLLALAFVLSCKKDDDPCAGITCQNGGSCIDGSCFCIGLWKGENCTEQVTPSLIAVKQIAVTKMPPTDANGAGWDLTSGPDVYIIVKQSGQVLFSSENDWVQNANQGTTWNTTISLLDVESPITIELWDFDDFDANDYMGGVVGSIYDSNNGFPQSIQFTCSGCAAGFTLSNITYL